MAKTARRPRFEWEKATPKQCAKKMRDEGGPSYITPRDIKLKCSVCKGDLRAGDEITPHETIYARKAHTPCCETGEDGGKVRPLKAVPDTPKAKASAGAAVETPTAAFVESHAKAIVDRDGDTLTREEDLHRYIGQLEGKLEIYEKFVPQLQALVNVLIERPKSAYNWLPIDPVRPAP